VASQKKNWFISDIARNAQTNIENLNIEFREEVIKRFECLEKNPFFGDIKKVKIKPKGLCLLFHTEFW